MLEHLVQPTYEERETVMNADFQRSSAKTVYTNSPPQNIFVLYVEKTSAGYSHKIGTAPDTEFISKLEKLLSKAETVHTRGL